MRSLPLPSPSPALSLLRTRELRCGPSADAVAYPPPPRCFPPSLARASYAVGLPASAVASPPRVPRVVQDNGGGGGFGFRRTS
uniref:Uncharacterized protein n=1 Tax=Oryza meridionalis TaxID=40149 RepID=A0A0E0EXA7_9ORYZ